MSEANETDVEELGSRHCFTVAVHPAAEAFGRIDEGIIKFMRDGTEHGGPTEAFGVRSRNGGIEVFERQSIDHVAWFGRLGDAQDFARALNICVLLYSMRDTNVDCNNR